MTEIVWIAARGPEEDRYRLHAEEPDAVGAFMCGIPPEGWVSRDPEPDDAHCNVCEFLASPMGLYAVKEGQRLRLRDAQEGDDAT